MTRGQGVHRAVQPRPSGSHGRRTEHRRRGRHPHPGPRRLPPGGRRLRRCPPPAPTRSALCFLPPGRGATDEAAAQVEAICRRRGPRRSSAGVTCPSSPSDLGSMALAVMPRHPPAVRVAPTGCGWARTLDRRIYPAPQAGRARRRSSPTADGVEQGVYFPSLSSRTLVYKGMLTTPQLAEFFPDIVDERVRAPSPWCTRRFSTNTFPSWPLAHPYRLRRPQRRDQHRSWATATGCGPVRSCSRPTRSPVSSTGSYPVCTPGASDTATFDEALELLHLGGYSLPHAVLMMIPEAWETPRVDAAPTRRAFYHFHSRR